MPAKKSRGKKQKAPSRKVIVKAGKAAKSGKFSNRQKALARVNALAKGAMAKLPPGRGARIDVVVNPFQKVAESSVWVRWGLYGCNEIRRGRRLSNRAASPRPHEPLALPRCPLRGRC